LAIGSLQDTASMDEIGAIEMNSNSAGPND
jgi:hypothetical protein